MGCDFSRLVTARLTDSFNPRTHMGCDKRETEARLGDVVSIHAPTWGATKQHPRGNKAEGVSIHAPTWGATLKLIASVLL